MANSEQDKEEGKEGILKAPVQLEGFKFRKGSQDWEISFNLQSADLKQGQKIQEFMNDQFVLYLVPRGEEDILSREGLEAIKIEPERR